MSLVKCKCGRYTTNGFLCTLCQNVSSIGLINYPPADTEEEEELEEYGITNSDDLERCDDEYDD